MATLVRLPSGSWRAQVRRKGRYISETFRLRKDAEEWALANESRIDRGEKPRASSHVDPTSFGHLINLHVTDMKEVGKCPRRSKATTLERLKKELGEVRIAELDRERLVTFGRDRAREGAGPATIAADLSYVKTVIAHAAAVHGMAVSVESVNLARIALKRLGLVGKSKARDRRPTQDELDRIFSHLELNPRQFSRQALELPWYRVSDAIGKDGQKNAEELADRINEALDARNETKPPELSMDTKIPAVRGHELSRTRR